MITDFAVKPNPHAVDSKSVSQYTSGRYTTYLPKFTVHPGWNLYGQETGLYAKMQRIEDGKTVEVTVESIKPSLISGRDYEYEYDDLRALDVRDYDYTDAWGDRHYQKIVEMWLVLNYDGTGKVMIDDKGNVVVYGNAVVIDA